MTGRRSAIDYHKYPSNLEKPLERIETPRSKGFHTPSCRCKKCTFHFSSFQVLATRPSIALISIRVEAPSDSSPETIVRM